MLSPCITLFLGLPFAVPMDVDVPAEAVEPAVASAHEEGPLVLAAYDISGLRSNWESWSVGEEFGNIRGVVPALASEQILAVDDSTQDENDVWYDPYEQFALELGGEIDLEGTYLEYVDGGRLLLSCSPAGHERAAALLERLWRTNRDQARLRVERFALDELPSDVRSGAIGVQDATALAARLGALGAASAHELTTSAFHDSELRAGGSVSALLEYDVEVAVGSAAFDPDFRSVPVGLHGSLRAAPGDGGWFVALTLSESEYFSTASETRPAFGSFHGSERGAVSLTIENHSGLRTTAVGTDLYLPDGRALVLTEETDDGVRVTIVRAVGGDSSIVRSGADGYEQVHLGAATRPRVKATRITSEAERAELVALGGSESDWSWTLHACSLASGTLEGVVETVNNSLYTVEIPEGLEVLDEYMFESDAALAAYSGPNLGTMVFTSVDDAPMRSTYTQRAADVVRVLAPTREAVVVRGRLMRGENVLSSFGVPVGLGSTASVVQASEVRCACEANIEIAENSTIMDPEFATLLDGLALTLRVDRGADGWLVTAAGTYQETKRHEVETGLAIVPRLERWSVEATVFEGVRSTSDGALIFGDLAPGGLQLRIELAQ